MEAAEARRAAERLTAAFIADLNEIGFLRGASDEGHEARSSIDATIMIAITQANVEPLLRDPQHRRAYDTMDAPPPDSVRRPVSTRAVAESIGLPAETVRRRVNRLVELGLCERVRGGVVVPQRVLASSQYTEPARASCEGLGRLYARLRGLGVLDPPRHPQPAMAPFPYRLVMRIWGDHLLRSLETAARTLGGLLQVMLQLSILRANGEGGGGRPVTVAALARRLGLPEETVRRNAARLVAEGRCLRTSRGLLMAPDVLERPEWIAFTSAHLNNLLRFYSVLDARGLLHAWEMGPG
ncbi:DeoR family transcriptional regulator [Phenylobacterium sp.]|uniref:DeoR family transcriptional regulator n=1 Tax=Phenylobacterium sp. TaxID=1871053 RepID=UPI0035ADCF03